MSSSAAHSTAEGAEETVRSSTGVRGPHSGSIDTEGEDNGFLAAWDDNVMLDDGGVVLAERHQHLQVVEGAGHSAGEAR